MTPIFFCLYPDSGMIFSKLGYRPIKTLSSMNNCSDSTSPYATDFLTLQDDPYRDQSKEES